ncbi:GSCFA domain-containing protein [Flagellimonas zhangzhouensis]|uniref:GSCFA family protein n=1 Tax=Flagellimonas zhangzhouensis TaxID=1073328 RepID=A0A1H2VWK6_9FLAO|nr:GSCFA domain-containing protein [Allomuricauda zhangzhouensis]SDQ05359.1 GSCFA family protein [Allomuricauda zhangzhouensis]SDW72344.1 GSCFA family protein [Allomuricauda zhangzhouensis]
MELQTKIPLQPADNPLDYQSKVVLLGSCFVENMGSKLDYFKFQQKQNPFGILFHPRAIENLVQRAINEKPYLPIEVFEQDGIWRCFDAHSDLRSDNPEDLLQLLNQSLKTTQIALEKASHIIITLGTAWVYKHLASEKVVANCHKVPQKQFNKKLLSVQEIEESLSHLIGLISSLNPNTQIIFTVSPVRHLKDGFVENQQSKAHLISSLHSILSSRAQSRNVSYFPSYEIMMDELRDYRFYAKDMVHPNELAVDYIWEKFKLVWISEKVYPIMDEVDSVHKGLQHRPFNPDSKGHKKFKTSLETKITYLQQHYPFMKFE